jgi:hypothetical protein
MLSVRIKTGYNGDSIWCHTNGKGTYDSDAWTNGGKNMFFVLAKKGWENIKPNKTGNAYDEYGTVTPITNSISNVLKYFNSIDSIILKPNVWDDVDYAEIKSENKEEEYKKVMPSLLYETYSNRGAIRQTNFGTRWNISALKPDNKLVYRYAIMEIERTQGEVSDREYLYIEDRVIYHD